MWSESDKCMVMCWLALILSSTLTTPLSAIFFGVVAIVYGCKSVWHTFKEYKEIKNGRT